MNKNKRNYFQNEKGVAAVEFALIAPILMMILIGIIDFGMYINQKMHLENTARAAAEYVMKGGDEADVQSNVINVTDRLKVENEEDLNVEMENLCECDSGVKISCSAASVCSSSGTGYKRRFFTVRINMNYSTIFPYPGFPSSMTLSGHARLQVE